MGGTYDEIVLFRRDGQAVIVGDNDEGKCELPPLPAGVVYVEVAAGMFHTVALRSDGVVVCRGSNRNGECDLPRCPPKGLAYLPSSCSGKVILQLNAAARWLEEISVAALDLAGNERARVSLRECETATELYAKLSVAMLMPAFY